MSNNQVRVNFKVSEKDEPDIYNHLYPVSKTKRAEEIRHLIKLGMSVKNGQSVISVEERFIDEGINRLTKIDDSIKKENDVKEKKAQESVTNNPPFLNLVIPDGGMGGLIE